MTKYDYSVYHPGVGEVKRVPLRNLKSAIKKTYRAEITTKRIIVNELILFFMGSGLLFLPTIFIYAGLTGGEDVPAYLYLMVLLAGVILWVFWHWWYSNDRDEAKIFAERNGLYISSDTQQPLPFEFDEKPFNKKAGKYDMFISDQESDVSFFVATYTHWPSGKHAKIQDYILVGKRLTGKSVDETSFSKRWKIVEQSGFRIAYIEKDFDYEKETDMRNAMEMVEKL